MRLAPEDMAAVLVLIESLDDDGYLADSLEDIADAAAAAATTMRRAGGEEMLERLQLRAASGCKASSRSASAHATCPSA